MTAIVQQSPQSPTLMFVTVSGPGIGWSDELELCAGAAWFRRVSAALQQDPGVTYRRWIAALLPDLLKGTFNHDVRTEVRLSGTARV